MKLLLSLVILALVAVAAATEPADFDYSKLMEEVEAPAFDSNFPQPDSFLEVGAGEGAVATYLPEGGVYDNPATSTDLIATLPESPSCTIRGQTIFEIRKMRSDAKQIGMAIMYEIQIMEKRKAYIEQMTSYLNDRIRELNKVKTDLAAEQRWIQVSNQRIAELAQKEKLIKLQDVMTCISQEQARLSGDATTKSSAYTSLKKQSDALNAQISTIRNSITALTTPSSSAATTSTKHTGSSSSAAPTS